MICVSIDSFDLKAAEKFGKIVEIRLDYFSTIEEKKIRETLHSATVPIILTLRSKRQGGQWIGTKLEQIAIIKRLAALEPDYLDIEYDLCQKNIAEIQRKFPKVKIILSFHQYDGLPDDLSGLLKKLRKTPAAIYKIAVMANSTIDALKVLLFAKRAGSDVLALAMGELGQITRILSPIVKNPWTYAALDSDKLLAPGQLTASELRDRYRVDKINSSTALYGLIGDPISYSVGHIAHNAFYEQMGVDAVYIRMQVTSQELCEFLSLAKKMDFKGLSVTIPLKEEVCQFVDELDSISQEIGAVNTLRFETDEIKGTNTDAAGALDAIEQHRLVEGKRVVIIGAGGSSRAIAYEAKYRGAEVHVLARRLEQARSLGQELGVNWGSINGIKFLFSKGYDVLINSTPSKLPIDPSMILSNAIVMDLLPKSTPSEEKSLLFMAQQKGCPCVLGSDMYIRQAIGQLQAWFSNSFYKNK